jgi:hypothetical protein
MSEMSEMTALPEAGLVRPGGNASAVPAKHLRLAGGRRFATYFAAKSLVVSECRCLYFIIAYGRMKAF